MFRLFWLAVWLSANTLVLVAEVTRCRTELILAYCDVCLCVGKPSVVIGM